MKKSEKALRSRSAKQKSTKKSRSQKRKKKTVRAVNTDISTFTAQFLQREQFPPLRYAVEGCLPEGLTILAGKAKIGKSWMALDFGVAVATGGKALGSIPCGQGAVLYCALEDNQRRLQRRMRQRFGDKVEWPVDLHFATELPRLDKGGLDQLEEWIEATSPALVIIDTLVKVKPENRRDSGYESDYGALAPLQELAGAYGVSILVVHHLRKMPGDDRLDSISGTTGVSGAVDSALVLERGTGGATLYGRGREIEEIEWALEFDHGAWQYLGEADEVHRSQQRQDIINLLAEAPEPMGPKEIADTLEISQGNARQLLMKMLKDGEVKKHKRGEYHV